MQNQSLPHITRHSEPRSPPESPGQPWNSHTENHKRTLKPIPTSQKPDKQWVNARNLSARLLTDGNQSPHTQTPPSTGSAATLEANPATPVPTTNAPKVLPYLPCRSTPNQAHWQEDQIEGISSLTI